MSDVEKLKAVRNMAFIAGFLFGLVVATIMHSAAGYERAKAIEQPFDHSNCQYPDRWSNPPNGCDNSDPAVPECIKAFSTKAGEDACIADFVEQNKGTAEKREAIKEHSKPFQQPVNQCGGK